MDIKVDVTLDDIANATYSNAVENCPIAKAIKRIPGIANAKVSTCYVRLYETPGDFAFTFMDLPGKAQRFIEKWDKGNKVKPFNFTLTPSVIVKSR